MSRDLYQTAISVQRMRIQINGRLHAVDTEKTHIASEVVYLYERMERQCRDWEEEIDKQLLVSLDVFPVWEHWLKHVKGVQSTMGAHLLYCLMPPLPDRGVGTWFKAAGLYVEDRETNRMPHKTKGERVSYNLWLRKVLWMQADIFSKVGGYYKKVYQDQCFRLSTLHAGEKSWNEPHIHSVARWATVKLFLSHLYEAWLEVTHDATKINEHGVCTCNKCECIMPQECFLTAPCACCQQEYTRKVYAERVQGHQYIPVPRQTDPKVKI
jgi:hypothetical protein